ncbi:carbohydrate ABC transporter permease [Halobaculum sp. MBLA0143]|uniref:carbohydrate ABC transporter permease n=1 Tax=Halobaculum sp. MBLA0143 TaxID=3079933 RepID=UPI0035244BAF
MTTFSYVRQVLERVVGTDDEEETVTDGGVPADSGVRERLADRVGEDFLESAPFWLPPAALVGLFVYGAVVWNVVISLTDYEGFANPDYTDLDFDMYAQAFSSTQVVTAGVNTLVLLVGFTVVSLAFGLVIAILVDRNIRFENTFRTIYLLPMSLSFVVTAQFWLWIYDYDGVLNNLFGVIGVGPFAFIGNQTLVLAAVVLALVWQFSGYTMVVYLAALRAIPTEHFEAARVDGASVLKMYWRVIVPQLKSATVSASVVLMVFALKAFDFLFALVGGYRPPNGADILATKMVREAFQNQNWAYGSAIAILLFLMALGVIGPYLYYEYTNDNL